MLRGLLATYVSSASMVCKHVLPFRTPRVLHFAPAKRSYCMGRAKVLRVLVFNATRGTGTIAGQGKLTSSGAVARSSWCHVAADRPPSARHCNRGPRISIADPMGLTIYAISHDADNSKSRDAWHCSLFKSIDAAVKLGTYNNPPWCGP
jgi:hypothetical protein